MENKDLEKEEKKDSKVEEDNTDTDFKPRVLKCSFDDDNKINGSFNDEE